ncbi:hypothetical protein PG984_015554 [Apiospora sp. TS-2023a]
MTTMMVPAQDAHLNVLEEIMGPELLYLQREATELLDRSLELADLIWELECKYLSQEPAGYGTSLTPITEYNDDDEYDFEELPHYDPERDDDVGSDNDDDNNYQLADLRAEAAELDKRSGEAWTLFCEEVVARLSPSSPNNELMQRRLQKQKQQQDPHRQPRRMDTADSYSEKTEACMPTMHPEAVSPYYEYDDRHLAELYLHSSASPHDAFESDRNDYYAENADDGDGYEEDYQDDREFMETIRQEYLYIAEHHLSSQAPSASADSGSKPDGVADAEDLPGLFENLMEGKEDGDEDSGYDEDEVEDGASYLHHDSGFVDGDDTDSDNESFKSCIDDFDDHVGVVKLKKD